MKHILFFLFLSFSSLAFAQTNEYRLWESFENYPGNDFSWLPAGWTMKSDAGNIPNPEEGITWHISGAIDMIGAVFAPTNGDYMAYLNGAFGDQLQDEWLVSPVFTPEKEDYLFFDANYAPFWMFFDYDQLEAEDFVFNFEHPFNSMQALISTDNGASWTAIWDASHGNYNTENIWDYFENEWHKIKLPLEDYAGKPVRVAFRLFGRNAQSAALDYIRVGILIPEASYALPQGFFFGGINAEGYGAPGVLMGAAYIPTVWKNTSPDATSFNWTLPDVIGTGTYSSGEENPAATYIQDAYYFPSLTVQYGKAVSEPYSWAAEEEGALFNRPVFFTGGNLGEALHDMDAGIPEGIGVGNYNLLHNIQVISFGAEDYLFGTGKTSPAKAIANYFAKPAQPYLLRGINIAAYKFKAPAGTELALTIYRMDATDEIKETLATAKWMTAEAIPQTDFYTISFPSFSKENLVIDDAIFVELSGFADKNGLSFGVYSETLQTDGSPGNAYLYTHVNDADKWLPTEKVLEGGGSTSLYFTLDLVYSFIAPENLDYDFHASPAGGDSKSFSLLHYFAPDNQWTESLPDWVTSSFSRRNDGTSIYTLTTAALPEGIAFRQDPVILTDGRGGKAILNVMQSEIVGVKNAKSAHPVRVVSVNNTFELSYSPEIFTKAEVFTVSGQKVGSYALPATGKLAIPASQLLKGIYIVKCSGKMVEAVKVMK